MILNGILSLAVYCNMIHIQSCYSVTAITNKYYAIKKHVQYSNISGMWVRWKDFFLQNYYIWNEKLQVLYETENSTATSTCIMKRFKLLKNNLIWLTYSENKLQHGHQCNLTLVNINVT